MVDPISEPLKYIAEDQSHFVAEMASKGIEIGQATEEYGMALVAIGDAALKRDAAAYNVDAMPWLPQLPEEWANEIYDRIDQRERQLASPNRYIAEYALGTAEYDDEIAIVNGKSDSSFLFTAEHATDPVRRESGVRESADTGTAGLAAVLAEDYGNALIMRGNQTSNVPVNPEHPMKPVIVEYLPEAQGFVSIHGINQGLFANMFDRSEIHGIIGLGTDPTEEMRDFAKKVTQTAHDDLGLHVIIGNDTKHYVQRGPAQMKYDKDGELWTNQLYAKNPNSSTNFTRRQLNVINKAMPVLQLEMTKLLRLTPLDTMNRDRQTQVIGAALGYRLVESIVKLSEISAPKAV